MTKEERLSDKRKTNIQWKPEDTFAFYWESVERFEEEVK